MPIVEVEGTELEFPDSMSNQEIQAVLQKKYPPKVAQPVTPVQQVNEDPYEDDFYGAGGFDPIKMMMDMPARPQEGGFSLANTVANIPSSFEGVGQSLTEAITSPVETAKTVGKALLGTGQLLYPGEQEYEQYPKALVEHYKGLLADPGKALEEDPIGTGADVYGLLRAGAGVGKNVARVGAQALPDRMPADLYQRGAKFSTVMPDVEREAITKTALKGGFMPTDKGVIKLNKALNQYDLKVNKIIDDATNSGKLIDRDVIYKNLRDLTDDVGGMKFEGSSDLSAIAKSIQKFEDHAKRIGGDKFTPRQLQQFKHDLYERISWNAKRQKGTPVKENLQRNLARSAKEAIEEIDPNIGQLNKEWGGLLNLRDSLQRSAGRVGNRDLFSITDVGGAGIGGAFGGVPGAAAGAGLMALRHPVTSARMGIGLHRLQNPTTSLLRPKVRDALLGLLQTGNIEELLSNP